MPVRKTKKQQEKVAILGISTVGYKVFFTNQAKKYTNVGRGGRHHLCATEHRWLKWIGDKLIEGRKCFDCWLLEAQLKQMVHPLQVQVYYRQLTDWSRASLSPFSVGAFLALAAPAPTAACGQDLTARLPPAGDGQVQLLQAGRRAARMQLLHCCLPQLRRVPR
jgi:hypothetical protein